MGMRKLNKNRKIIDKKDDYNENQHLETLRFNVNSNLHPLLVWGLRVIASASSSADGNGDGKRWKSTLRCGYNAQRRLRLRYK